MTRVEPQWVQHMREALEEFVQDVRQSLPEQPSVADIERTLLEAQRQLMRDLMQSVVDDHAPPPLKTSRTQWKSQGRRYRQVNHLWGKVRVPLQCFKHRENGNHESVFLDSSLDRSGWTPASLDFLGELVTQLPAETASELAQKAGMSVSRAELDRLGRALGQACNDEVRALLVKQALAPLERDKREKEGRVMVLQMDGCFVLGQAQDGKCSGIEIKTACMYPQNAPRERTLYSSVEAAENFCDPVAGLLRQAGVRHNDTVVLVGDGAAWIARIAELQNIPLVLDVFHASHYLDGVMQASDWTDIQRSSERKRLLKGEIRVQSWLETYLPPASKRETWSEEAKSALAYLQARLPTMDYPVFLFRGWPIGSGQIEGINKSVIGHRMKRSGQHWSRPGARGMASLRARRYSRRSLLSFDHLRHAAFSTPHF